MYKGLTEDIKRSEVLDRIINNDRSIKKTLLRRGYTYQSDKQNASKKLLMELPVIDRTPVDSFYQLMQEQSNRVILKKLCSLNRGFTKEQMQKNWAPEKIDSLLSRLQDLKIIVSTPSQNFQLQNPHAEFGENLEWYVAELFRREFYGTADWGVHIVEAPAGGDYDVLARLENQLVYVECKAKRPDSVKESEFISFLKRDEFLRPHMAIFFIDSTDKIAPVENMFNNIGENIGKLKVEHGVANTFGQPPYTERIDKNVCHFQGRLFIANSRKPALDTFKFCLRHRHRTGVQDQATSGSFWLHQELNKVEKWW